VARGGYEIDIDWKDGKLTKAVVRSKLGGICKLRSNTPLKGKGLRKTKDANVYELKTIANQEYTIY
jgi:alpha-L-fucosidase 2